MKPVWLVILSIIISGVLCGGGIYYYENKITKRDSDTLNEQIAKLQTDKNKLQAQIDTLQSLNSKTNVDNAASASASDWKTYTNTTYGFSLNFPDSWKGYSVYERPGDGNASKYLYFQFPTTSKDWVSGTTASPGHASIFSVAVYTKANWSLESKDNEANGMTVTAIGQNSNYVFTSSSAQDLPEDVASKNLSPVKTIISSFKSN